MMKWWRVFFWLIPANIGLFSLWWESKATAETKQKVRKRYKEAAKAQRDLVDAIFKPVDDYMKELWQEEIDRQGTVNGMRWDFNDFEVELINEQGLRCGTQTITEIQSGRTAYCRPGQYGAIRLRSPSREAFKYATVRPKDLGDLIEEVTIELTQKKYVMSNDTLSVSLPITINKGPLEFDAGNIVFKWECKG